MSGQVRGGGSAGIEAGVEPVREGVARREEAGGGGSSGTGAGAGTGAGGGGALVCTQRATRKAAASRTRVMWRYQPR